MAYDTYLKIAGVEGESSAAGFEKQIEVDSFSWSLSNPSTMNSTGSGLAAGRVNLSSFSIAKRLEKSSARLFAACCQGEHFDKMELMVRKATGKGGQDVYLTYTFHSVLVESVSWSAADGQVPQEVVTFAFAKVEIEYKMQDTESGQLTVAGQASWDLKAVMA